jgi:transketolase
MTNRPTTASLAGKKGIPRSLERIIAAETTVDRVWVGSDDAVKMDAESKKAYEVAHDIMKHLAIEGPLKHKSGHPGGPLSAFTFSYGILRRRNPKIDRPLVMSAGHLSLLAYGLNYLGGRRTDDPRLASPEAIIDNFRTPQGLPGHAEAGIGDIPFGCGPLGKGLSNGLGFALGKKLQKLPGTVDVLIGDGDSQEGQILEAARIASKLELSNLIVHADVNDVQLSGIPTKVAAADLAKIFESMGWAVIEVENGNDPSQVEAALDAADELTKKNRPIFIAYYTTMGYGVETMEKASDAGSAEFHGAPMKEEDAKKELAKIPSLAELTKAYESTRKILMAKAKGMPPASSVLEPIVKTERIVTDKKGAARKDFGAVHIKAIMKADPRVIVLHGDLAASGGFDAVEKEFPERVINCGAAEANMYMMAAGLRQSGLLPVTYTFAAFGTNEARANARLIDVNCGHIPCGILNDCTHSGLSVGEDGETHQDRNYLNIPFDHTQVWMPADSNQAAAAAEQGLNLIANGSTNVYVFSPRSGHEQIKTPKGDVIYGKDYVFDGKIDLVRGNGDATDVATIIACGIPLHDAISAAESFMADRKKSVRVLNAACIRPFDASAILQAALETQHLIVVEDHHSEGGLASQVADVIADYQLPCTLRRLGVNHYFPSGTDSDLKFLAGLDSDSVLDAIEEEITREASGGEDAFVTSVFAMLRNTQLSRFRETASSFLTRLAEEKGYLEHLREIWKNRTADVNDLPNTADLRRKLRAE